MKYKGINVNRPIISRSSLSGLVAFVCMRIRVRTRFFDRPVDLTGGFSTQFFYKFGQKNDDLAAKFFIQKAT